VAVRDLLDDAAQPLRRLHGSKTAGVVFVQKPGLAEMLQHGGLSVEDSRHDFTNEQHDPDIGVVADAG
jgi:hypothetical protein